ncbi:DUF2726 domain-containing protein [Maritalea mobilis]|uniref:DUF2726 domain-containing protein n=1 Tax=Maritalea mobilis TaxID=483324 RepID=UPI0027E18467|nr:DUF2726 domain-containing protein [Maritalea mobilis]
MSPKARALGKKTRPVREGRTADHHVPAKAGLAVVDAMPVAARPVLNRAEDRLFEQLDDLVSTSIMGHNLLAQVSLGEFLMIRRKGRSYGEWQSDFNRVNAKRVDFLIVDRDWNPVLVIEYQGAGHYGPDGTIKQKRDAEKRDAIKRMACMSAGIGFMEVVAQGLTERQEAEIKALFYPPSWIAAE